VVEENRLVANEVEVVLYLTTYKEKKFTQSDALIQKSVFRYTIGQVNLMRNQSHRCEFLFRDIDKQDIVGFFKQRDHSTLLVYDNAQVCQFNQKASDRV